MLLIWLLLLLLLLVRLLLLGLCIQRCSDKQEGQTLEMTTIVSVMFDTQGDGHTHFLQWLQAMS